VLIDSSLARKLVKISENTGREYALVVYENGSKYIYKLSLNGGAFPIYSPDIKYVFHTHPVPRYTPSLADIVTAYNLSRIKGAPVPLYTASRVEDGIVVYEIKIHPSADINKIAEEIIPIEKIISEDYEKYSKIQHYRMLSKRHITIARYLLAN